jgi:flavin-dependent dehydrogenase
MRDYDVAIVGGGPAGSTCARALTQAGHNVVVVDKSHFPRDKVCAGWITPQVIEALQLDVLGYRQNAVFQPMTGFVTAIGRNPGVRITYNRAVSYGIRRCEFDDFLLRRSRATLELGAPVRSLRRHAGRWVINDSIRAPMLIGAGGHFCPVAQFLGASVGGTEIAVGAQEIEFEAPDASDAGEKRADKCTVSPTIPELYFCDDLKGYGWCLRKGRFINVGLGREDPHGLAKRMKDFWIWLVARGKVPSTMHPRFHGHAYLTRIHSPRAIVGNGMLLVGDAAGLAYPESGEGIRPAIESGLMAARIVRSAEGEYSLRRIGEYPALLQKRFGVNWRRPTLNVPSSARTTLARSLLRIPWFVRHVVLNRSFLHMQQKALLLP